MRGTPKGSRFELVEDGVDFFAGFCGEFDIGFFCCVVDLEERLEGFACVAGGGVRVTGGEFEVIGSADDEIGEGCGGLGVVVVEKPVSVAVGEELDESFVDEGL